MISLEEYLKAPCRTLSIPYWKNKNLILPDNMQIVHCRDFDEERYAGWHDERYFRMSRGLPKTEPEQGAGILLRRAEMGDLETMVSIINRCYTDLRVSAEQLRREMQTPAYAQELWCLALEEETGVCMGCAIGALDPEAGELSLEWVQVLPERRNRSVGRAMVHYLLWQGRGRARFATVSGKQDDPGNPAAFYRKCGFSGEDIWHILRKYKKEDTAVCRVRI